VNVDHMSLYCGGMSVQHNSINKGRCGLCGDSFSGTHPHQAGGTYATGTISRSYMPGQVIDIELDLVANHLGFFTFAICPHNDQYSSPARSCFEKHPLKVIAARKKTLTPTSEQTYFATKGTGLKRMKVALPKDMTCTGCILQYTYTTGNNWGKGPQGAEVQSQDCLDPSSGGSLGCGIQETFRGCADICIGSFCPRDQNTCKRVQDIHDGVGSFSPRPPAFPTRPPTPPTHAYLPTRPKPTEEPNSETCELAGIKAQYFSIAGDQYCKKSCLDKTKKECFAGGNTRFLCYCENNPTKVAEQFSHIPVVVDVVERNNVTHDIWMTVG